MAAITQHAIVVKKAGKGLFFFSVSPYYPHVFLSEGEIVIPSVRPSVRPSVMLSPPKPLDEIQPNLVCELLT